MAMQSGYVIQDKVARLVSKQLGKPVLKPNKSLALKDEVANRKPKKGGKERCLLFVRTFSCLCISLRVPLTLMLPVKP